MVEVKKTIKKEEKPKKKVKKEKVEKAVSKEVVKEIIKEEIKEEVSEQKNLYYETVGRRKTAVARVRIFARGDKSFLVNGKPCQNYFPTLELQQIINSPLEKMNCSDKFGVSAVIRGGGIHAQAEAVRHGISRALVLFNVDFRKRLKKSGYLTRDARMRERKKFGLKRARRAPQWQKR